MINNIKIEEGKYGPRAFVTGEWRAEMTSFLINKGVMELELNDGKGWQGKNLSFLYDLNHLKAFKIIDLKINSVEPIHWLSQLKALEVITYCKTKIDFLVFPELEECALEWHSLLQSIFECVTLKKLFINNYDGKNVDHFSSLINLEALAILNAPVQNLLGLQPLRKLHLLRLGNLNRLSSLEGLEDLTNLEELDINTCRRIDSIEAISCLVNLKRFYLNNSSGIKSFKPLQNLNNLESVVFYESTDVLDGDLSPLLNKKNLSKISFKNRRHYSLRREQFGF